MNLKHPFLLILSTLTMTFVVIPLLVLFFLPLILYRSFVFILAKFTRRDLISFVKIRDCIFANDGIFKNPKSNILVTLFLEGDLELKYLKESILKIFLNGNPERKTNQPHPMLLQVFERWGGFVFKKWEQSFNIDDHVKEWRKDGSSVSVLPEDLYELRRNLLNEPYQEGTSPWEILLVRNYLGESEEGPQLSGSGTIVICKFHHGLVDGFSLSKLCLLCTNASSLSQLLPQATSEPLKFSEKIAILIKLYTSATLTLMDQLPRSDPHNIFHPSHPETQKKLAGRRIPVSTWIPISVIKEAVSRTGTSYTAVVMAGLAGGIQSYLTSIGRPVPKEIDLVIPLPWPGHADRIGGNHFTFALLHLPTGLAERTDRVQRIYQQLLNLKSSSIPALNNILCLLTGSLPNFLMRRVLEANPCSILFSSLPGPRKEVVALESSPLKEILFEGGYGTGDLGMGFSTHSYNNRVSLNLNPEEAVIPSKEEATRLLRLIVQEMFLLQEQCIESLP